MSDATRSLPTLPTLAAALANVTQHVLLHGTSATAPVRVCEVNPPDHTRPLALAHELFAALPPQLRTRATYTVITCQPTPGAGSSSGRSSPSMRKKKLTTMQRNGRVMRLLDGGPACSVRGGQLENDLGACDVLIVGFYTSAETVANVSAPAMRMSLLLELPYLLQHAASPRSVIALHGSACPPPHSLGVYSAPYWVRNISEHCWHTRRWTRLASSLHQPACQQHLRLGADGKPTPPASTSGIPSSSTFETRPSLLCTGTLRPRRSACASVTPLLERWQAAKVLASEELHAGGGCAVRKEMVTFQPSSFFWKRATYVRSTLSHLARRHLRYYSVFECGSDVVSTPTAAGRPFFISTAAPTNQSDLNHTFVTSADFAPPISLTARGGRARSRSASHVCLLFKDDVLEEWVAGLNATDGLAFHGDPSLVMPRLPIRALATSQAPRGKRPLQVSNQVARQSARAIVRGLYSNGYQPGALAADRTGVKERLRTIHSELVSSREQLHMLQRAAASMTHNLALTRMPGSGAWLAVGGRHNRLHEHLWPNSPVLRRKEVAAQVGIEPDKIQAARVGIWMMRGDTWRYASGVGASSEWYHKLGGVDEPQTTQWREKRLVIDGRHPGCVERRHAGTREFEYLRPGVCEYDGRLSLVAFRHELLLYTRSNPASHGSRHVQVTRSRDGGVTWQPFEQLVFDGYEHGSGDIYFFGAQINPAHNASLIAVFPLVHQMRGCLAIAASIDGVHWSRITPLLSCGVYGERTLDQPAVPSMVRRGRSVWLYVHEEVPSITIDRAVPLLLQPHLLKAERSSRVVRYAFSCRALARWTHSQYHSLHPRSPGLMIPPFSDSCTERDGRGEDEGGRGGRGACSWTARGGASG